MPKVKDTITPALLAIAKGLKDLPDEATKYWKSITPVDTGNAKRRTKKSKKGVNADYEYASYLDKGHSKQAPDGMSEPTRKHIDKIVKKLMKKGASK